MSVSVVCPSCGEVISHYAPPASACPHCAKLYPDTLRRQLETALQRERLETPFLIKLAKYGTSAFAAVICLFLVLAPFNIGTYTINDETVTGPEFLRRAGLAVILLGALSGAAAVGLWRSRAWARTAILAFWVLSCLEAIVLSVVYPSLDSSLFDALIPTLFPLAFVWWYLFRKRSMRQYFDSLPGWDLFREDATPPNTQVGA